MRENKIPDISRRKLIGSASALIAGGYGWNKADIAGDSSISNPPQDLNGDGLFEDINGDGSFNWADLAAYTHEDGEEIISEYFEPAFDFSKKSSDTESDFRGLYKMLKGSNTEQVSDRKNMSVVYDQRIPLQKRDQINLQLSSALNYAANTLDQEWKTEIDNYETTIPEQTSPKKVAQILEQILEEDGSQKSIIVTKDLISDREKAATYELSSENHSIATGAKYIPDREGNPMFTESYAETRPIAAAGLAWGMGTTANADKPVLNDELIPTSKLYTVLSPLNPDTIEERKSIGSDTSDSGLLSTGPVENMAYTTLFSDKNIRNADFQ